MAKKLGLLQFTCYFFIKKPPNALCLQTFTSVLCQAK